MKPTIKCCNLEFEPAEEGLFEIDDGLLIACYCPMCEFMITVDYSSSLDYWETDLENLQFWEYVAAAPKN